MRAPDRRRKASSSALIFVSLFAGLTAVHAGLLRLPYFWDEAGYYVPAARDLLLTGSLIPHSTPSNAHPPLVMAYLALCWKIAGYAPIVTRLSMLLVAAFALLGVFRLAQRVANTEVAIASTICTALYPVFFTQSLFAQVDLAAAALTFWGLLAYVENRRAMAVVWFSLAVLAKETAILAPVALVLWECVGVFCLARITLGRPHDGQLDLVTAHVERTLKSAFLLIPAIPLALWYAYHHLRTGFTFGNPEFFRYNVQATMHPLRIFLALLMRIWQVGGYMNLYPLTLTAVAAMLFPTLQSIGIPSAHDGNPRPRVSLDTQFAFYTIVATYVAAMAVIGGAVLARYMLPVVPLIIIVCVSTLWRRVRLWRAVVALVLVAFIVGLFVNPPYGFTLEDNLAFRDFIRLHQNAETYLQAHYPKATVLTAWPASGELSQPSLGYVARPMHVLQIENFGLDELMSASELPSRFDVVLVFSTKYDPPNSLLANWKAWNRIKTEYFGYHRDLPPAAAAQILGGRVVYMESRDGQWIGVIEIVHVEDARVQSNGK